jgi:hypothetical protein
VVAQRFDRPKKRTVEENSDGKRRRLQKNTDLVQAQKICDQSGTMDANQRSVLANNPWRKGGCEDTELRENVSLSQEIPSGEEFGGKNTDPGQEVVDVLQQKTRHSRRYDSELRQNVHSEETVAEVEVLRAAGGGDVSGQKEDESWTGELRAFEVCGFGCADTVQDKSIGEMCPHRVQEIANRNDFDTEKMARQPAQTSGVQQVHQNERQC